MYVFHWKPKNWSWVRDENWIVQNYMYDTPYEVHGPGAKFDPNHSKYSKHKYIVGAHPHGLYPIGITKHFTLNKKFMRFRTCVHWMLTTFPIFKEFTGWAGCVDATRECMSQYLDDPTIRGLVVCPGSVREGVIEKPGTVIKRSGFISIAQKHNAHLIPVYDATVSSMWDIKLPFGTYFHSKLRYPWIILAKGRSPAYISPYPKYKTVHLYIGNPISTQNKQLGELMDEFYNALHSLKEQAKLDGHLSVDAEWK